MAVFQQSTNQGCEITIYRQQGQPGGVTLLAGKTAHDALPSLLSCHVVSALGGGGSFGIVCKPEAGDTFFDSVVDDDWVDIVLTKNGKRWHVMRGLVDEVRCSRQSAGSGTTTVTYSISGRSFQKVLTDTQLYLNIGTGEDIVGELAHRIGHGYFGSIKTVVRNVLTGVLQFLAKAERGAWAMPLGMYGTQGQFYNTFAVNADGISAQMPRQTEIKAFAIDNGSVWSYAQQYSDPLFTELFCDQIDFTKAASERYDLSGDTGLGIDATAMTVIFRDKPFIAVDPRLGPETGEKSPWFSLPQVVVDRQQIIAEELGRSGQERLNAFSAFGLFGQTLLNKNANACFRPVWAPSDMYTHGLRRFDATSNYSFDPQAGQAIGLNEYNFEIRRKLLLKDWYALNPRYLNGTMQLGTGAPHVHIGTRLYVPGQTPKDDLHAYVEGVSHTWQMPQGTRTSITLTRGYRGTDKDHLAELQAVASPQNYQNATYP